MKYLTVVRHAKSSWDQQGLADHDRPLNHRGRRAAPAVGSFLARTYFGLGENAALLPPPDRIVSSTAARAVETAQILRESLRLGLDALKLEARLYLAEPETLLDTVRGFDEGWSHVIVVAHNPGLHDFADRMLARTHVPRMPTCTAVIMGLPHEYWGLADWYEAQLIGYITPKALERRFPELYEGISMKDGDD